MYDPFATLVCMVPCPVCIWLRKRWRHICHKLWATASNVPGLLLLGEFARGRCCRLWSEPASSLGFVQKLVGTIGGARIDGLIYTVIAMPEDTGHTLQGNHQSVLLFNILAKGRQQEDACE
jgi:hypothetical protein